jgi:hypothetical protein
VRYRRVRDEARSGAVRSASRRTASPIGEARVAHVRRRGMARFSSLSKRGKAASVLEGLRTLEEVIDAQW